MQSERLAGAIILSRPGAYAGTAIAVVILVIALTGKPGIIVPFLVFGFGIVASVWRQFNTEFGTVVAEAPDGLRLRSGLMQTAAETIRPGRVQAVRLVEPLFWRAFGWCQARGGRGRAAPAPGEPLRGAAPARAHPGRLPRRRGADARRAADRSAAAHPRRRQPARA